MNDKIIDKLVKDVEGFIDFESHYGDHHSYMACNVKLRKEQHYCDNDDIIAICKQLKLSKAKTQYIEEVFTNEKINNLWYSWIEMESYYLQDDYFNKCCISSSDYWNKEIEKVKKGKDTSYPDINNIKERNKKIKELEKGKKKDQQESNNIDILKNNGGLSGFFGRGGGWYAILKTNALNIIIDELYNNYCWEDKIYYYQQLKELYNACQWGLKLVEEMKNRLDFKTEIEYRIGEELEQEGFIEDSSAIEYSMA